MLAMLFSIFLVVIHVTPANAGQIRRRSSRALWEIAEGVQPSLTSTTASKRSEDVRHEAYEEIFGKDESNGGILHKVQQQKKETFSTFPDEEDKQLWARLLPELVSQSFKTRPPQHTMKPMNPSKPPNPRPTKPPQHRPTKPPHRGPHTPTSKAPSVMILTFPPSPKPTTTGTLQPEGKTTSPTGASVTEAPTSSQTGETTSPSAQTTSGPTSATTLIPTVQQVVTSEPTMNYAATLAPTVSHGETMVPTTAIGSSEPLSSEMPSDVPSDMPSSLSSEPSCGNEGQEKAWLSLLETVTPSATLSDLATPQGKAFVWLNSTDEAQLDPCTSPTALQRYALTVFYYSTMGSAWNNSENWLTKASECEWFGITCNNMTSHVLDISLVQNNLFGPITQEIKALKSLERFVVYENGIQGTLPSAITELRELQLFDVERNSLVGEAFDASLPQLTKLTSYRVSQNRLEGTIVPGVGLLSNLKQLWFAGNVILGTLPRALWDMPALESLIFYQNQITGTISPDISSATKLKRFLASENLLSGPIPTSFWQLTDMTELRLDSNYFNGTIDSSIGLWSNLKDLRIGNNLFSGTFPSEITKLSQLEILVWDKTFVTGSILDDFNQFDQLGFVDLSYNALTGSLPSTLFQIPTLEVLYLNNNRLTGSIPSNYGSATLLRDLYLNNNNLNGTVPSIDMGQFMNLTEFKVEYNNLQGSMPASICALVPKSLMALSADCGGAPPQIMCTCCTACVSDN